MNKAFRILIVALLVCFAFACAVCAWQLFTGIHFFVKDAVGDVREIRGDGLQPAYWSDFMGYLWFYIPPAFLVGLGSLATALAFSISRGLNHSPKLDRHA